MVTAIGAYAQANNLLGRVIPYEPVANSETFSAFEAGFDGRPFSSVISQAGICEIVIIAHMRIEDSTLIPMIQDWGDQYQMGKNAAVELD